MSCTHHDNFARRDAVVDRHQFNETMLRTNNLNDSLNAGFKLFEPIEDLASQIQEWLKFETQLYGTSRVGELERNGTIFTVWFSLWDLWYYSEKNTIDAQYAVTETIDMLFKHLDVIADNWPSHMRVIVPEAIDPTFLPLWHRLRTGPRGSDPYGETQRNAVLLVKQWNQALDRKALRWQRGSMYIYNTNEWLVDQVRGQQLFADRLSDANGVGSTQSPWSNVRVGCTRSSNDNDDVVGAERCSDPNTYLFLDDIHFGDNGMKMIGEGIAQDIVASAGKNSGLFAHEIDTT